MTCARSTGSAGAPWERPLAGALDELVVESDLLAGNPLDDPARRPLYVYRSPGVELDHPKPLPSIYFIQGYTGQLDMVKQHDWLQPNIVERVDAMFADGDCPAAIVVFVDCWTSYGGSQFLNSTSTGPYQDYLCDEVVQFVDSRYPTAADRDHRGLTGKSSGGYGAMVVPMMRPDVFGALASHAGDALFESVTPRLPAVARILRDDFEGSWDVFFDRLAEAEQFNYDDSAAARGLRLRRLLLAGPRSPRQGAAAVRARDRPADRRRLAAVARARPGADGAGPRRRAALHAAHLPRRRQVRRVLPRSRRHGVRPRARQARRRVHARALRRQARRDHLPLPGRDPRARAGPLGLDPWTQPSASTATTMIAAAVGGFLLPLAGMVGALLFYSRDDREAGRVG